MKSKSIFATFVLALLMISTISTEAQENLKGPQTDVIQAAPDFRPRGVFALVAQNSAPTLKIWQNPCIDGVRIIRTWSELNPDEEGVYDWAELDTIFAKADTFGKRIHLMVIPGFRSPEWVLKEVETTEDFLFTDQEEEEKDNKIKKMPLPIPWSLKYLNYWFTFVDALGKKFGAHPALSLISITGPNSHNGEVILQKVFKKIPEEFDDYDPLPIWRKLLGGGPNWEEKFKNKMLTAYDKTMKRFRAAFPPNNKKYFSLQITNHALPIRRNSDDIQNSYHQKLQDMAYTVFSRNFVLMNGGLEGKPVYAGEDCDSPHPKFKTCLITPNKKWVDAWKWSVLSHDVVIGFQTRHPSRLYPEKEEMDDSQRRQIFEYAIRNSIGYGADFIEVYTNDINQEFLQDWIAYASIFSGGQLSPKEVERKCECLKSVKFKTSSLPVQN